MERVLREVYGVEYEEDQSWSYGEWTDNRYDGERK